LKLPLGGEFSCLNLISPSQSLRSDLTFKYQYIANSIHDQNGNDVARYHEAVATTIDSLTSRVREIKECCENQQKGSAGCGACVSTPDEIAKFFRDKGYIAIPIKILTPVSAKGDSISNKLLAPGVDVCSQITAIEIDGQPCLDFPTVVSNIVAEWPGGSGQAVITDNDCMCTGGLESVFVQKHKSVLKGLKIQIWRNPDQTGNDLLFSDVVFPDQLGVLPFHGYLPISNDAEKYSHLWDKALVKSIVQGIFSKNGFQLSSFEWSEPSSPLKPLDLYNKINENSGTTPCDGTAGSSIVDLSSSTTGAGSYLDGYKMFNSSCGSHSRATRNYWTGYVIAHEYLHQMLNQYISHIANHSTHGNSLRQKLDLWLFDGSYLGPSSGGHCAIVQNLLFPGNGMEYADIYKIILKKEPPVYPPNTLVPPLNVTDFLPGSWSSAFCGWEKIVPNQKRILALGYLSNTIYNKFGFDSCESRFIQSQACNELLKLNFERDED
jgi:hypothetical protein